MCDYDLTFYIRCQGHYLQIVQLSSTVQMPLGFLYGPGTKRLAAIRVLLTVVLNSLINPISPLPPVRFPSAAFRLLATATPPQK